MAHLKIPGQITSFHAPFRKETDYTIILLDLLETLGIKQAAQ